MTSVLIVEDNARLRRMVVMNLVRSGYDVLEAENGEEALDVLDEKHVELIIADIMMPELDGITLTEMIRDANNTVPILIITAKDAIEDKRRCFKLGADDYMVKPVEAEELLLRVEALLRRAQIVQNHILTIGETTLDQDSLTTRRGSKITVLPQKEFFLLQKLLSYPGKIFTRQSLMDEIWGYESNSDPRTVDVHIKRLREKFWDCEDFQIDTVRGLGYRAVHGNEA